MQLSTIEKIAQQFWSEIPNHFVYIYIDPYVVIPNHICGIVVIDRLVTPSGDRINPYRDAIYRVSTTTRHTNAD